MKFPLSLKSEPSIPVLFWMEHFEIPDDLMPRILGIDEDEYRQLRNDPYDGPFHKLSPDLIINFCRHIRVHPAHLCSSKSDFRHHPPERSCGKYDGG